MKWASKKGTTSSYGEIMKWVFRTGGLNKAGRSLEGVVFSQRFHCTINYKGTLREADLHQTIIQNKTVTSGINWTLVSSRQNMSPVVWESGSKYLILHKDSLYITTFDNLLLWRQYNDYNVHLHKPNTCPGFLKPHKYCYHTWYFSQTSLSQWSKWLQYCVMLNLCMCILFKMLNITCIV